MNSTDITIQSLIDQGLLHPEAAGKHPRKHPRFNDILNGRGKPARESQVTTFMTMFGGDLERCVVRFFCTVAGAAFSKDLQITSGGEFRDDSETATRRTIDLVVVDRNEAGKPGPGGLRWKPVVAVEAKYGAWVNGGNGFCSHPKAQTRDEDGHLPYSNQAICYLHGCIDGRLNVEKGVRYVWLGEGRTDTEGLGPWGKKGLHPGDAGKIPGYAKAYEAQGKAIKSWAPVSWVELGKAITEEIGGPEAEAIVRFLRAGGPSAN